MQTNDLISVLLSGKPLSQEILDEVANVLATYQNLNLTQENNIEILRSQLSQLVPYVKEYDSLISKIDELEKKNSTLSASMNWCNTLRNEVNSFTKYFPFVEKKDANGLFDFLNAKTIVTYPDPIPLSVCVKEFAGIYFHLSLDKKTKDDDKIKWLESFKGVLSLVSESGLSVMERGTFSMICESAVRNGFLKAGEPLGAVKVSRLSQLGLERIVNTANNISIAMNWS